MYQFASAAYAATAKLALTGTELQAEVLFASARRIHDLLNGWPAPREELDAVLDHATRVWSLVLGDVLDDEEMPQEGQDAAARIAGTVFDALHAAVESPSEETLTRLVRITARYAQALRRASTPTETRKRTLAERLRARSSSPARNDGREHAKAESVHADRRATA